MKRCRWTGKTDFISKRSERLWGICMYKRERETERQRERQRQRQNFLSTRATATLRFGQLT